MGLVRGRAYGGLVADRVNALIAELRDAILASSASGDWWRDDADVFDLVQHSVTRWADDLERSLRKVESAVSAARAHGSDPGSQPADELEEAFAQVVSARDKMISIAAQVLSVPSLRLHKEGVRFEPDESRVKALLSQLGSEKQAGRLKSRLDALADHPAVTLRNQILHALSPLGEAVAANCWFRTAQLDDRGGIVDWSRGPLFPEHTLEQGDIKPETIWAWAVGVLGEAQTLLIEATTALAKLIASVGTLGELQAVYRWPDGRVQLERPASDLLQRGLTQ